MVVHHDREHISRGSVRAQQHKVVEIFIQPDHAALNLVLDHRLARQRCFDADDRIDSGRDILWIAIATMTAVKARTTFSPRLLAHGDELLLTAIAAIRVAGGKHLLRYLAVTGRPRKLEDDFPVPGKTKPGQSVDDGIYGRCGGTLAVGVLDPQQHLAAMPAGV